MTSDYIDFKQSCLVRYPTHAVILYGAVTPHAAKMHRPYASDRRGKVPEPSAFKTAASETEHVALDLQGRL